MSIYECQDEDHDPEAGTSTKEDDRSTQGERWEGGRGGLIRIAPAVAGAEQQLAPFRSSTDLRRAAKGAGSTQQLARRPSN